MKLKLSNHVKRKWEMTQIINIRNEIVTTDPTDIRRIIKRNLWTIPSSKMWQHKKMGWSLKDEKKNNTIINNLNGTFFNKLSKNKKL